MIPSALDPRWRSIVTGSVKLQPSFFATQMLLSRVTTKVKADPSEASIKSSIDEVHAFFVKYESKAGPDLKPIFS